jgi:hypothetical protein
MNLRTSQKLKSSRFGEFLPCEENILTLEERFILAKKRGKASSDHKLADGNLSPLAITAPSLVSMPERTEGMR